VDAGDAETGATVHLVDADYDTGPVLAQVRVPVNAGDRAEDVEQRVQRAERQLVVDTLAGIIDGRVKAGGGAL
ncbi:MAG: phosphoribosylglycinamide formyltransferase, partial [Gammaproteobacteria bacterium]|nr:phosphoribosylglycinamide formyltransferase [Gammaproteobacteria bacterium]